MARPEAIAAARSVLPLNDTHVGILEDEAAIKRVNDLLAKTFEGTKPLLGLR